MRLLESGEDYLERILMLKEKHGNVRAIDITNSMNFSKPSVSIALHKLSENGYVVIQNNGAIELTEKGLEVATSVYERHKVISTLLMNLGVSEETALEDACKIEHDLSEETFNALKEHLKKHQ